MKKLVFLLLFLPSISFGQIREFDQLEMLYAQQHYKLVLFKSNRLLNKPEFDFSLLPSLYKSFALFQLSQNERWYKRNSNSLQEAANLMEKIKNSSDGKKVLLAHMFEVSSLKADLYQFGEEMERIGDSKKAKEIQAILEDLFDQIPNIDGNDGMNKNSAPLVFEGVRGDLLAFAQTLLGTPYLWAGTSPKGFDCSGFTSFVFSKYQFSLPRRAADQFEKGEKVKEKNAKPGDLIFFTNGSGISHVGILMSNGGDALKMIHASSSQGIVISEVTNSAYWQKRIAGFTRFIED